MAIIDIFDAETLLHVVDSLGVGHLVHSLINAAEDVARTTRILSSDARSTLESIALSVDSYLITTVNRLAQQTDTLSSDARTTLASTTLLMEYLITAVERLTQTTDTLSSDFEDYLFIAVKRLTQTIDTLSSDVSATIASTALLVENLIATMNALALNMNYLLQGCITLVALLCLLTVLCIVRWCYAFSRELRGVQHLKTA